MSHTEFWQKTHGTFKLVYMRTVYKTRALFIKVRAGFMEVSSG